MQQSRPRRPLTGNDNDDDVTIDTIAGPAADLAIVSGNNQSGVVGTALANPFVIKLADANGNPIEGETITFAGGSVSPTTDTTEPNGQASTTLTLSETVGPNIITASYDLLEVEFTATGTPDLSTATFAMVSGGDQTGTVGTALAAPFVVSVKDQFNNAISGIPVTFAVTDGGGSVSVASQDTDAQGQAQTVLTLGTTAGDDNNKVTASVTGKDDVIFEASATADDAAIFAVESGNDQSGTVNTALDPFVAKVTDQYDNPISGVEVTFSVTGGGGALSETMQATGVDGKAQTLLTLGTVAGTDNNTVTAAATGFDTLTFTASADPGDAVKVSLEADKTTLASDTKGSAVLTATLKDEFDNTVPQADVDVTFTLSDGTYAELSTTEPVSTNASGVAEVTLTTKAEEVPTPPATTTVQATADGLTASEIIEFSIVNFSAEAEFVNLVTSGEPNQTTITAVGATTYVWSVQSGNGSLAADSTDTAIFTAPATIAEGSPFETTVIRVADATDAENVYAEVSIKTYEPVTVENKPEEAPVVLPGEDSETFTVAGGDGIVYTWNVVGPDDYSQGEEGESFTFTAPTKGAFAVNIPSR